MRRSSGVLAGALVLVIAGAGCGGPGEASSKNASPTSCNVQPLPLGAGGDAPTVVDVRLDCDSSDLVLNLTVEDPQGIADIYPVDQIARVYTSSDCSGSPIELIEDIAVLGDEESFDVAISQVDDPALYATVSASPTWPVYVDIRDTTGNRSTGVVAARVTCD